MCSRGALCFPRWFREHSTFVFDLNCESIAFLRERVESNWYCGPGDDVFFPKLRRVGLRMKSSFTVDHLPEAMSAPADSFGLGVATVQAHLRLCLDGQEWTLLGVCVNALVKQMTEPMSTPEQMGVDPAPGGAE